MKTFLAYALLALSPLSSMNAQQIPVYYNGSSYADCNLYNDTTIGASGGAVLNAGESGVDNNNCAVYVPFLLSGSNVSRVQGAVDVSLKMYLSANTAGTYTVDLYGFPNRGTTAAAQNGDYSGGTVLATSVLTGSTATGWQTFDVTDFAQQQVDAGNTALVFKLKIHETSLPNSDGKQTNYAFYPADSGTSTAPGLQIAVNQADASTFDGKVICGYQGWFRCLGDPSNVWSHWNKNATLLTGSNLNVDFWPDMSLYSAAEQYSTPGLNNPDGSTASLFSNLNYRTVLRQFQWMEASGIDGVFLQKFCNYLPGGGHYPTGYTDQNTVQSYVQSAAGLTGRVWALEYDASGTPAGTVDTIIENHWQSMVDSGVTSSPGYLHHNGLPVIAVFGFFHNNDNHQLGQTAVGTALINYFHTAGKYQAYIVGSGDWNWVYDGASDPDWMAMMNSLDAFLPWNVGNGVTTSGTTYPKTGTWQTDLNTFAGKWVSCIFPGTSNQNEVLNATPPGTPWVIARRKGQFFWEQFMAQTGLNGWTAKKANTAFIAMFDEFDEGTGIMPATNTPPPQAQHVWTYEGLPSDTYLEIAGIAQSYLKNGFSVPDWNLIAPTQASSYNSASTGINTQGCSEGGLNVCNIANGSCTVYNSVNLTGVQSFEARVASATSGGSIQIRLDSPTGTLLGTALVPPTSGWQTWVNVFCPLIGASGFHNVYLVYGGGSGYLFNVEWFTFTGAVDKMPATVFSSSSSGIGTQSSSEGSYNVDNIINGSYTAYNNVNLTGMTQFTARVASPYSSGTINVCLDGTNGAVIASVPVPNTGGWQTWTSSARGITATSGTHNVYLVYKGGSGYLLNLEWLAFTGGFNATEAASFNSASSGVSTQGCSEGGLNVDCIVNGSYTAYNNVNLTGMTNFTTRLASNTVGGNVQIRLDSPTGTLIGACTVGNTGGWQTWTNASCGLTPTTGFHTIYLVYTGGSGYLLNVKNFQLNP